jgi:hypothetical protein
VNGLGAVGGSKGWDGWEQQGGVNGEGMRAVGESRGWGREA